MSITKLMIAEHRIIDRYLKKFQKVLDASSFKEFNNKVKQHFDLEEGAIFRLTEKFIGKEQEGLLVLRKQHKAMLKMMKKINLKKPEKTKKVVNELSGVLIKHAKYEEKVFYPKLDTMLEKEQVDEIMQKLREIV